MGIRLSVKVHTRRRKYESLLMRSGLMSMDMIS